MKNNNSVGTFSKSNSKIIERGKIDIPNTQIHDRSLSWHGTCTSIHDRSLSWHGTCTSIKGSISCMDPNLPSQ